MMASTITKQRAIARNEELLHLVKDYQRQGAHSEAAQTLFRIFLPELTRCLRFEFPTVDEADFLSLSWEVIRKGGFERSDSPCAWVIAGIRESLRRRLLAERHGVSEYLIRSGQWKKLKKSLSIQDSEVFVRPVGEHEETLFVPVAPTSTSTCEVWNELEVLLKHLHWPAELARSAVEILDSHADIHGFHSKAVSRELAKMLPVRTRENLIAFVTETRGYLWARLHNISAAHALSIPVVRAQILALRYQPAP